MTTDSQKTKKVVEVMDTDLSSTSPKIQLADKLKSANNILVTVSRNPSVDQLASCIGLTLMLNKLNKHAAAVFSGQVPSTLEFLQPEDTLEKNTDSLRDFIIALDKSKADKLRYKVEDEVVRIFITPYKTSISEDDLEFSQGDFNVDVVVALGVTSQDDLDEAITAHGRILHDATIATINTLTSSELGGINWQNQQASSLSEMVTELSQQIGKDLLDNQIATALLTGVVAETERFSNDKTTAQTMNASATLMAAGANQQLVATKLDETPEAEVIANDQPKTDGPEDGDTVSSPTEDKSSDGQLEIDHEDDDSAANSDRLPEAAFEAELPAPVEAEVVSDSEQAPSELPVPTGDEFQLPDTDKGWLEPETPKAPEPSGDQLSEGPKLMTEPPTLGGTLTANTQPEGLDPTTDPFSQQTPSASNLLDHQAPMLPTTEPESPLEPAPAVPNPSTNSNPIPNLTPPPPAWVPPSPDPLGLGIKSDDQAESVSPTLSDLESSVHSEHITSEADGGPINLNDARDEVSKALSASSQTLEPIQALNAQPMASNLNSDPNLPVTPSSTAFDPSKFSVTGDPELPQTVTDRPPASSPAVVDPNAPPPVPPPIPFQFGK